jgi:phosphoribosylglycinamide formyltransferase-1
MNIGILASHFGSTLQAIIDAYASGRLRAVPRAVISNNSASEALRRAERAGIRAWHLSQKTHPEPAELDRAIVAALRESDVAVVVLAGYMRKLGAGVIHEYSGRILNTHPALLPKFGGQGMYGMRVHEAVIRAGERETGVTIHVVDAEYDAGPIVAQKRVAVLPDDDAHALSERVQQVEREFLVETLDRLAKGELRLPG